MKDTLHQQFMDGWDRLVEIRERLDAAGMPVAAFVLPSGGEVFGSITISAYGLPVVYAPGAEPGVLVRA